MQSTIFEDTTLVAPAPFKTPLLKWIGNKQRFAHTIASYFPKRFGTYFEPFLGSGAVLATVAPEVAVATDFICTVDRNLEHIAPSTRRIEGVVSATLGRDERRRQEKGVRSNQGFLQCQTKWRRFAVLISFVLWRSRQIQAS